MNAPRTCENCNAPRKDAVAIMLRCWGCIATNDQLYATRWAPIAPVTTIRRHFAATEGGEI